RSRPGGGSSPAPRRECGGPGCRHRPHSDRVLWKFGRAGLWACLYFLRGQLRGRQRQAFHTLLIITEQKPRRAGPPAGGAGASKGVGGWAGLMMSAPYGGRSRLSARLAVGRPLALRGPLEGPI